MEIEEKDQDLQLQDDLMESQDDALEIEYFINKYEKYHSISLL